MIGALIALNVAGNLLRRSGLASDLLTSVGIIVGLDFIGLCLASRMPRFLWIAGAMCAVSTLAAFVPAASASFHPRNAATGFANAVALWIGASYLRRLPRAEKRNGSDSVAQRNWTISVAELVVPRQVNPVGDVLY